MRRGIQHSLGKCQAEAGHPVRFEPAGLKTLLWKRCGRRARGALTVKVWSEREGDHVDMDVWLCSRCADALFPGRRDVEGW